jgi:hypothetical protein
MKSSSAAYFLLPTRAWPGYASLLPIIGACIVLVSNNGESKLVNNSVTHALGKWSYSIYLWHWPIVVAGYYFELGENWWAIGIPLSLILGALSFKYIESKTLSDFRVENLKYVLRPLPFAALSALIGLSIFYTNGFLFRLPPSEQVLVKSAIEAKDDGHYPKPNMKIGSLDIRFIKGRSDKNILVMGASHIEHIILMLIA